jgi:hypothetical protein
MNGISALLSREMLKGGADDPVPLGTFVCVVLFYDGESEESQEVGDRKAEGRTRKAVSRNKKWFQVTH